MASLFEISAFLDDLLEIGKYPSDASNNGLQYEGVPEVARAVFAVDACEEVFRAAAERKADLIFVHHGISWGPGIRRFRGLEARRFTALAKGGMSLYAAHLPLDAHEMIGHNALISGMIGMKDPVPFGTYAGYRIGFRGDLPKPVPLRELARILNDALPSEGEFRMLGDPASKVRHPVVISGGGAWPALFQEIEETSADCLITGEASHTVFHYALETGTQVLMLGHYRSETPGVISVMNAVREKFGIKTEFLDCPTGM